MIILAIDPGNEESGFVLMNGYKPVEFGKESNISVLARACCVEYDYLVIEMVAHYGKGMPAGKTVFDTCVWIGRFEQAAWQRNKEFRIVLRMEEKMNLCGDSRAKDGNVRQALIDRFAKTPNGKGTKKDKDWFYGFREDIWSAYACGVTWLDKEMREQLIYCGNESIEKEGKNDGHAEKATWVEPLLEIQRF